MEGLSQCKSDSDNEQGTNKYYFRDPCNQTNAVKVKLFYGAIYSIGCLLFPCVSLEQDCITHKHKKGIAMKIMKYDRFSVLILGQYLIGQKYVIFKTNKITLVRREEPTKNVVGFKNVIDLYNDISNVKTAEQFHWLKFLSWGWKLEIKAQISTIAVFIVVKQQIFFFTLKKRVKFRSEWYFTPSLRRVILLVPHGRIFCRALFIYSSRCQSLVFHTLKLYLSNVFEMLAAISDNIRTKKTHQFYFFNVIGL